MLFSMAVVLSGNNFQKIERFSKTMSLHVISWSTFHMYQRLYICPGIEKFYFKTQVNRKLFVVYEDEYNFFKGQASSELQGLAGDGRCDSPGSSAKFCTYLLMDTGTNKILHAETIDKREVHLQSSNMERKGILRALNFVLAKFRCSVTVDEVITDASTSVQTILGMYQCVVCIV